MLNTQKRHSVMIHLVVLLTTAACTPPVKDVLYPTEASSLAPFPTPTVVVLPTNTPTPISSAATPVILPTETPLVPINLNNVSRLDSIFVPLVGEGSVKGLAWLPPNDLVIANNDGLVWVTSPFDQPPQILAVPSPTGFRELKTSSSESLVAYIAETGQAFLWNFGDDAAWPAAEVEATSIALNRSGTRLAVGDITGMIHIFDVETQEELSVLLAGHALEHLAFSPDGSILVSVSTENRIQLWDVEEFRSLNALSYTGGVDSLSFSPDGIFLALGEPNGSVSLWFILNVREMATLTEHTAPVTANAFSPDGMILASGDDDGAVILWDVALGSPVHELSKPGGSAIKDLAWSLDGTSLAVGTSSEVTVWQVMTNE